MNDLGSIGIVFGNGKGIWICIDGYHGLWVRDMECDGTIGYELWNISWDLGKFRQRTGLGLGSGLGSGTRKPGRIWMESGHGIRDMGLARDRSAWSAFVGQ